MGERARLAAGFGLLAVGVASGIWFTERLRVYPGPPLEVALGELENATGDEALDDSLELLLDEGRFVVGEGAGLTLEGRIERDGPLYRIDVRVVERSTDKVLAEAREAVSAAERLPSTFDGLSAALRRELARAGM